MKTIAIIAAIAAIVTAGAAYAETMPKGHLAGSPIKQGKFCWVYTDGLGHGWWDTCDPSAETPRGLSLRGRTESDIAAIEIGGASGGGGSGGGGGGGGGR